MSGQLGPKGPPGPRGLRGPPGSSSVGVLYGGAGITIGTSGQNGYIISTTTTDVGGGGGGGGIGVLYGGAGISIGTSGQNGYIISSTTTNVGGGVPSDFISVPNAPTNLVILNKTSTSFDLSWNYPLQTQYAFGFAPSITNFIYQIVGTSNNVIRDTSNSQFINPTHTTLQITSSSTVPLGISNNILRVPNITDISYIVIGYGNPFGITLAPPIRAGYLGALAPAAPVISGLTNVNTAYNTYTNTLSWITPLAEAGITTSTLAISSYDISYNSSGSTTRFQSAPIIDSTNIAVAGNTTSRALNTIMPDATYNFQIKATNTAIPVNLSSSFSTPPFSILTSFLQPKLLTFPSSPVFSSTITVNSTNIKSSASNTAINNLITSFSSAATISTKSITWPVQTTSTRGKLYLNNNRLTIQYTNNLIPTNIVSFDLSGCNATTNQPIMSSASGGIFINGKYEDSYLLNSNTSYQGFYTNLSITSIDISTTFFTPSPNTQTLDIFDTNGPVANKRNILTYSYDGLYNNSPPSINAGGTSLTNLSTAVLVTGISIYNQLKLSINTTVSNIGTYFYVSPVLNYTLVCTSNTFTSSEINLNNLDSILDFTGGGLKPTVTFKNPGVFFINPPPSTNIYSTSTVLQITAKNAIQTSSVSSITIPNVIIDQPSFNLAFNTLQPLVTTSNIDTNLTNSRASRFISSVYGTDLSGTDLSTMNGTLIYNNDKSILSTSTDLSYRAELPIINGLFSFPSTYNSTDFSTTGNRRYATFIWKMSTLLFTEGRNTLTFEFKGTNEYFMRDTGSNNVITSSSRTIVSLDFNIVIGSNNTVISDTTTTSWINGALTSSENVTLLFNAANTNNPNAVLISPPIKLNPSPVPSPPTSPIGTIVYTLPSVFITKTSEVNGYVLLRVGLPMNSGFTFSNILASLTNPL